tara:strand:- start:60 stop:671 length:612 start_codon:yes stop_codon:yes gene_type:complete
MYKKIIFSIILASSLIYGQNNNGSKTKMGIGLEFSFLQALLSSESGSTSLYIPIHINQYMIEPEIIYFHSKESKTYPELSSADYTAEDKGAGIAIGVYSVSQKEKLNTYYGLKLGYLVSSETPYASYSSSVSGTIETTTTLIAPTIGAEYYIADNFTIGGEVALQINNQESTAPADATLTNYEYTEEDRDHIIRPKFMVRFYF